MSGNIYIYNIKKKFYFKKNNFYTSQANKINCKNKYNKGSKDLVILFSNLLNLQFNKLFLILKSKNVLNKKLINLIFTDSNNIFLFGFINSGKSTFIKNLIKNDIIINNYNYTTKKLISFKINSFNYNFTLCESFYFKKNSIFNIMFFFIDSSILNFNFKFFFKKIKLINFKIYNILLNYYKPRFIILNKTDLIKLKFIKFLKLTFINFNWNYILYFLSFKIKILSINLILFYLKLLREWRNRYTYQI